MKRAILSCLDQIVIRYGSREESLGLRLIASSSLLSSSSKQQTGESEYKTKRALLPMGDYSDHDPQDEKFPSEVNPQATPISSSEVNIEHPGMLYILFHAALMALLACLVAGLGLVGIFFISDFISQSIKLLSNGSRGGKERLSSVDLAALVKARQEELREALMVAKKEKAIARERQIRDEVRMIREAAAGSFGWSWR
jgi:hypothetical protein